MHKLLLVSVAVVSFNLGCGSDEEISVTHNGGDHQSPLPTDFAYNCDEVEMYIHLLDTLPDSRNSNDPDILALREEIARAIERCQYVELAEQHNDVPSDWNSFEFNGRTYYHTPLTVVPPN